ncbi:hypothetical protein [Asticcacaulis sp. 201]|uniref:capsular polysaccharide export protein, LipB/KpsS family n=1 Tax=Asticcacaulis sp. 201 TaxID=3028787 RepID=UPI0029165716|nr:hypothetical protein [Asticcacaulis sp. 201]MDV6331034.1 hypothetical protein [Asticcacaulis sp. 201]
MNVHDACVKDFRAWAGLNTVFWKQYDLAGEVGLGAIYVDLMHDHPGYLLRNILAGRLLGLRTGRPVIGLTGEFGIVPTSCPRRSASALAILAQSFGVELVTLDNWQDTAAFLVLLKDALHSAGLDIEARGSAMRDFLRTWTLDDGLPVGRLLYDSVLRIYCIETLDFVDERVVAVGANLLCLLQAVDIQFSAWEPVWFVTGHSDYSPYGLIADRTLRRKGKVLFIRNEGFVRAHILEGAPKLGQTLQGKIREQSVSMLQKQYETLIANGRDHIYKHVDLVCSHGFHLSHRALTQSVARPEGEALRAAQSFILQALNLDPAAPTVVLYTITFSDIALNDTQIFADNYVWLEEVLAFAYGHPEVNWVIRVHPNDEIYNTTGAVRRLIAQYEHCSHIHFLAHGISPQVCYLIADMATTVRGSPGILAAYLGIPVVLCGRGFYSDLGLARVAESRDAYFRMLLDVIKGRPESPGSRDAAAAFIFDEVVLFNIYSTFLGEFDEATEIDYWQRQIRRIKSYDPMGDQFARALFYSVETGQPRVSLPIDVNFMPATIGGREEDQRTDVDFSAGSENLIPVLGPHEAEAWGTWLPAGRSAFLIYVSTMVSGGVSVRIRCRGLVYAGLPKPSFRLELNGYATSEIEIDHPEMAEFLLEVPGLERVEPGYQFLGIVSNGGGVPIQVGINEDVRHLTVAIECISIVSAD